MCTVTAGKDSVPPNGAFEMEYSLYSGNTLATATKAARGLLYAAATGLSFAESTNFGSPEKVGIHMVQSGNTASGALTGMDYSSGSGVKITLTFGYDKDKNRFCRKKGTDTDVCFDMRRDNADRSTWEYGVYDDDTGARFALAQPSFGIKNAAGDYGHASYYNIWFPTTLSDGGKVIKADGATTSYTVKKPGARMYKVQKATQTLDSIDKVPLRFTIRKAMTLGGVSLTAWTEVELYWDKTNTKFNIIAYNDPSTFMRKTLTGNDLAKTGTEMRDMSVEAGQSASTAQGLEGWSEALGGGYGIPASTLTAGSPGTVTGGVVRFTQTQVYPGDASVPTTLKCATNCFTKASLSVISSDGTDSPFTANTYDKWGNVAAGSLETYTFDKDTFQLKDSANNAVYNGELPKNGDGSYNVPDYNGWKDSIQSGPLVSTSDLSTLECSWDTSKYCSYQQSQLSTYYLWMFGTQDWSTSTFLQKDSDSTYVQFSAPAQLQFTVPANTAGNLPYKEFAGATMILQYEGFGQLHGIPGQCFNRETNLAADCSSSSRFVPAFSIPYGAEGYAMYGNAKKWIKPLATELRLKKVTETASALGISFGSAANIPVAPDLSPNDAKDPSDPANTAYYAGAFPADAVWKQKAKVTHGDVKTSA